MLFTAKTARQKLEEKEKEKAKKKREGMGSIFTVSGVRKRIGRLVNPYEQEREREKEKEIESHGNELPVSLLFYSLSNIC